MAGTDTEKTEELEGTEPEPKEPEDKAPEPKEEDGAEPDITDTHGQPGINKERHDKEVKELNDKIAELQAKVDEAAKTEESRTALSKEIDSLKAELASSKVTHELEMAGCVDVKAAKARLEDFEGDVAKLKEACPYLFGKERKTGSTGGKPEGATSDHDQRVKAAREAAGLPPKKG